jgi:hypothetical protein
MAEPSLTSASTLSTALAWWGAVLSTSLAGIKVWEVWRDRFQIEVDYSFTTDAERGNRISIHNLSGRPLILTYWELLYGHNRRAHRKFEHVESGAYDSLACTIAPHTTHDLHFDEERHFAWNSKVLNGRNIYVRLHFAGRKPIVRLVYPE